MFKLHPKLAADCFQVGNFPLSRLLMINDSNYPWFILVPRVPDITEIYQLTEVDQVQLAVESSVLSETLARMFGADKMNIAALGNVVSQLHVHHVVRFKTDLAWPDPVWGKVAPAPYVDSVVEGMVIKLESAFSIDFKLG